MTRCSCGAFLEEHALTRLTPAERTRKPPTHPHNKQRTQQRQREQNKKLQEQNIARHQKKEQDDLLTSRRSTSKAETDHGQGRRPSTTLTPSKKPGVLQQKKTTTNTKNVTQTQDPNQNNKQDKGLNSQFTQRTKTTTKQDPCRSKVWQSPNPKGRKGIPTAPLLSYSHPPDPRKESGGTGYRQEGGRGDPFSLPRDKIGTRTDRREDEEEDEEEEEDKDAKNNRKGPRAHCKSPRAKINNGS